MTGLYTISIILIIILSSIGIPLCINDELSIRSGKLNWFDQYGADNLFQFIKSRCSYPL